MVGVVLGQLYRHVKSVGLEPDTGYPITHLIIVSPNGQMQKVVKCAWNRLGQLEIEADAKVWTPALQRSKKVALFYDTF